MGSEIKLARTADIIKGDYRGYIDQNYPYPSDQLDTYTVFIGESKDEDAMEEIDVVARSDKHAREIAKAAIALDYQAGVKILELKFRPRGIMFI